jgi:hypothetical protein
MKKHSQLSAQEQQLIERLRRHPELMERFQNILEIGANVDGPIQTADQVEELLVEEMRRLGNTTLKGWAESVEERLSEQLQHREVSARVRKKKC